MMLALAFTLLVTAANLPPDCHMVAEDTTMLGGVRVGAASLGACCRACNGGCRAWAFSNATCRVNVTGRVIWSPGETL